MEHHEIAPTGAITPIDRLQQTLDAGPRQRSRWPLVAKEDRPVDLVEPCGNQLSAEAKPEKGTQSIHGLS
jgi:hypothetical protein